MSHRVISGGKDVTETEGTGIVHTAPGAERSTTSGGRRTASRRSPRSTIRGSSTRVSASLTGKNAVDPNTADAVFEELKKKDRLFVTERYVHRYPHCWRCKTELLYRLVDEWFINMGPKQSEEGFRGDIMKVVDQVTFLPESLNGKARELDWLRNMGDWMISKKRYWGLALPIWVMTPKTRRFRGDRLQGGIEGARRRGLDGVRGAHPAPAVGRPDQDPQPADRQRLMSRIPDVGNPWLDAGIVAFSTMKYNTDRDYWRKWYPADFITESFPGQFRNWFYALLAMSTMMSDGEPPFKTLLGHGLGARPVRQGDAQERRELDRVQSCRGRRGAKGTNCSTTSTGTRCEGRATGFAEGLPVHP
jgi:isoleucyl-tRNA synthetase